MVLQLPLYTEVKRLPSYSDEARRFAIGLMENLLKVDMINNLTNNHAGVDRRKSIYSDVGAMVVDKAVKTIMDLHRLQTGYKSVILKDMLESIPHSNIHEEVLYDAVNSALQMG